MTSTRPYSLFELTFVLLLACVTGFHLTQKTKQPNTVVLYNFLLRIRKSKTETRLLTVVLYNLSLFNPLSFLLIVLYYKQHLCLVTAQRADRFTAHYVCYDRKYYNQLLQYTSSK